MPPPWVQSLATIYVPLALASALLVLADIFLGGRRQKMPVMDAVWPLTMLYWGPLGLPFYGWFGRAKPGRESAEPPMWQAVFSGAAHCGAGCALGDFAGAWIVFATSLAILGSGFAAELVLGLALAYLLGILFQYFAIAPMRGLGLRAGVVAAVRADTLSLLAYEVGMFGCMAARPAVWPGLRPTSWSYWLLMQAAMLVGFATTCPINWWLIQSGIKERM